MSEKIYDISLDTISRLADIVNEKELGEITITAGNSSVTVKGKKCPPPAGMPAAVPAAAVLAAPAQASAGGGGRGIRLVERKMCNKRQLHRAHNLLTLFRGMW